MPLARFFALKNKRRLQTGPWKKIAAFDTSFQHLDVADVPTRPGVGRRDMAPVLTTSLPQMALPKCAFAPVQNQVAAARPLYRYVPNLAITH